MPAIIAGWHSYWLKLCIIDILHTLILPDIRHADFSFRFRYSPTSSIRHASQNAHACTGAGREWQACAAGTESSEEMEPEIFHLPISVPHQSARTPSMHALFEPSLTPRMPSVSRQSNVQHALPANAKNAAPPRRSPVHIFPICSDAPHAPQP